MSIEFPAPATPSEIVMLNRIYSAAMIDRTCTLAAINAGSRNLAKLAVMADALAALGSFGRTLATAVRTIDAAGRAHPVVRGDSLDLVARPKPWSSAERSQPAKPRPDAW